MAAPIVAPKPRKKRPPMTEEQKEARRLKNAESERRFNEAVARMPDLPPDQMSEDGCIRLVGAFWAEVHDDLAHGNPITDGWLDTDDFNVWASIGQQDPDNLRAYLREKVWKNPRFCNCMWKKLAMRARSDGPAGTGTAE